MKINDMYCDKATTITSCFQSLAKMFSDSQDIAEHQLLSQGLVSVKIPFLF